MSKKKQNSLFGEKTYTAQEISERWNVPSHKVRQRFEGEHGVLSLDRIPESILIRAFRIRMRVGTVLQYQKALEAARKKAKGRPFWFNGVMIQK